MLMMLPFEAPTIFEGIHKSYFRMPQVVRDQRGKFENDDLFRQLSHESAIKYTGFKDRPLEERQMKFITNCHEGHTEISVVQSGNQFTLMFNPAANPAYNNEGCDFDKEHGKVHIKAGFILNGVCVMWRGWIDVARLEGFGCLEFDEYRAYVEDTILKQQIDKQTCNNTSNNHQQSPLSHLNNHLALGAVHSVANSLPPVGLNTSCLGPPPPSGVLGGPPQPAPPPPVSLADSAAHYGNAAIAAAAAAAFHQALSVGGPPPPQALHRLGVGPPSAVAAAAAAAAAVANGQPPPPPPLLPGSGQHLSYTNGTNGSSTINIPGSVINSASRGSPPNMSQHHHHMHNTVNNNNTTTTTTTNHNHNQKHNHNHSPERDQNHHHRRSTKRSHEELTHIDDVDVVSDTHSQDLDFPPRRIFKSEPLTTAAHHHHRATRRA